MCWEKCPAGAHYCIPDGCWARPTFPTKPPLAYNLRMHRPGYFKILLCAAILFGASAADADNATQTQQQLKQIQQRISALKSKIERDQKRRGGLSQALAGAEKKIAETAERLHNSQTQIAARKRKITTLDTQQARQKKALQKRLGALSEQIRAAYRTGAQSKLRLLFSQTDPSALGRLLIYHDYYAKAQAAQIAGVRQELGELRSTRTELASQRDALETQRQEQSRLLASLRGSQKDREKALAVVDAALAGGGHKLKTLKADQAQLQEVLESVRKSLADIPTQKPSKSFAKYKGIIKAPVSGRLIAKFGQTKSGGPLHWQGVWIAAPAGSPVTAAAAGRIVYVGYMRRYGLIVVMDHGDDYFTVYGHAQAAYVQIGQWVRAGEIIAAAGTSGGHKTSGVYFEIRHGQTPIDPAKWLSS